MFKIYRDASDRYLAIGVRKWLGVRLQPCEDGRRRSGLHVLGWYRKSRTRAGHWDVWIPSPFKK